MAHMLHDSNCMITLSNELLNLLVQGTYLKRQGNAKNNSGMWTQVCTPDVHLTQFPLLHLVRGACGASACTWRTHLHPFPFMLGVVPLPAESFLFLSLHACKGA
jgi:hypothetical protein